MATNNEIDDIIRKLKPITNWVNETDRLLIRKGLKPHPSSEETPTSDFSTQIDDARLNQLTKDLEKLTQTVNDLVKTVDEVSSKQKKLDTVSEVVKNIKSENESLRREVEKLATPARRTKRKENVDEQK